MKNKRILKNVIMIVLVVGLGVAMVFTSGIIKAGGNNMPTPPNQSGQQLENGQSSSDSQSSNSKSSDSKSSDSKSSDSQSSNSQQPPAKPDGDSGQAPSGNPPDMQNNSSDSSSASSNSSSASSDSSSASSNSNSNSSSAGSSGQAPSDSSGSMQMPSGGQMPGNGGVKTVTMVLTGAEALAFAMILIFLIMSRFNKKTIRETLPNKKKIAVFVVITVLAGGALGTAGTLLPMKLMGGGAMGQMNGNGQMSGDQSGSQSSESVDAAGATEVDGTTKSLNKEYTSTTADQSAVVVKNSGKLTSDGATINKKSGDGSSTDNCDFYGVNAGLLVNSKSSATVKNATIKTSADKSNAVFCTGEGSTLNISDSTITTTGKSSCRGLDATYGGKITADNVKVTTQGGSCATLATDRGEGTVAVTDSTLETNGSGSPVIYSTGTISINNTKGTANGSQMVVVEGENSATVKSSTLNASAAGNRGDVDVCGVMLYQSMSGDAGTGTSKFTAKDSSLSIDSDSDYYDSAPMFFVTNTSSVIKLTNTDLSYGSGTLLSAKGTSDWGTEGSNGGKVKLYANDQTLKGNVVLDDISTLSMSLKNGSAYKGTINGDDKAKSVKLTLSKDSTITLTGDSYVSSLDDEDSSYSNIDFNGHKLYVDGKAISK